MPATSMLLWKDSILAGLVNSRRSGINPDCLKPGAHKVHKSQKKGQNRAERGRFFGQIQRRYYVVVSDVFSMSMLRAMGKTILWPKAN